MSTSPAPARIWGFVASEAPRIVLLRRGLSKWTQMWLWNTETDEFKAGSWFAGHIYYRGCDISPDGKHFIYHATNQNPNRSKRIKEAIGIEELDEWFSLCCPPYFTSLSVWKTFCFLGSAYFYSNSELVWDCPGIRERQVLPLPPEFKISTAKDDIPLVMSLYRTGWIPDSQTNWQWVGLHIGKLDKGSLSLEWQDQSAFSVSKVHTYTYTHPAADLAGVSWADLDQQGRLVYTRAGCVYRHTEAGEHLLADLNTSQPPRPWLNANSLGYKSRG